MFFLKLLAAMGKFIASLLGFCKKIAFISFLFVIAVFILAIFMPENVQSAINIAKNILKIP